ncbi:MAG: nucleotidyl transferase AbiEii/AbiGii toxin family protein [bacterium]
MITPSQIQSLAKTHQIDNFTILREYLQLVFLGHLYSDRKSKHIYFKGGTAIRLLMGSPRFSEDLDFSTTLTKPLLQQVIHSLEQKIQKELPTLNIYQLYSEKTGIRYQIKYHSPDFKYPLNLRLDFTIVKTVIDPVVSPLITDFPITIFPIVIHLSSQEILAEKICALASRTKGRDYYDTWYLLEKNIPLDATILNLKIRENKLDFNPNLLLKKIKSSSQKTLSLDLAQFLPKSQKRIIPLLLDLLVVQLSPKFATINL